VIAADRMGRHAAAFARDQCGRDAAAHRMTSTCTRILAERAR
jgi:hypothetical protein